MPYFTLDRARPLGKGLQAPASSVTDAAFLSLLRSWRRSVASAYRALIPADIGRWLPHGPYVVSPKIDGELWFLVFDEGQVSLVNPAGRVIVGIPVLEEMAGWAGRVQGRTVIAGELFAATKAGRARSGDVAEALGGEAAAQVQKLGFAAFDLLAGGDQEGGPEQPWDGRHATLGRILAGGKRASVVKAERVGTTEEVSQRFAEWVEGGKGEGLVVRVEDGRIYKVKPEVHLDAVVVGMAERGEDPTQASSLLLALMREDGSFQLLGSVGNLGTEEQRRSIRAALCDATCPSRFRYATVDGTLFSFLRPEKVVEIRVTDLLTEGSNGERLTRMALHHDETGWTPLRMMPAVSPLFPVFERFRDDKSVNPTDVRLSQLLERCYLSDATGTVAPVDRPASTVLLREVYTKTTKGKVAVRKLLLWKTNKEQVDPSFPAYVVHFTDYSPGRADPLERTVRLAPDEPTARALAAELLAENIKKGWEKAI